MACSVQDNLRTTALQIGVGASFQVISKSTLSFFVRWISGERHHRRSVISGEIWQGRELVGVF